MYTKTKSSIISSLSCSPSNPFFVRFIVVMLSKKVAPPAAAPAVAPTPPAAAAPSPAPAAAPPAAAAPAGEEKMEEGGAVPAAAGEAASAGSGLVVGEDYNRMVSWSGRSEKSLLCRLRVDPSRCNATIRQNPPFQQNVCNA